MKRKLLGLLLMLLVGLLAHSQNRNYFKEFGLIPQAELSMNTCSFEANADAIVLFDVGKSSFERMDNSFDVVFNRITRIKILNEAGLKHANVEIPYYQQGDIYELVKNIRARTYEIEDGKIVNVTDLDLSTCYDEKYTENWKLKKFAMPNVKAGSIIEYTYNLYSQYHFNLRDWDFQWDIPVLYSEYEVRMIPFYDYTYMLQGRNKLDIFENYEDKVSLPRQFSSIEYRDMVYRFGLKNVPSFSSEEYITSKSDYVIKIDFQMSGFTTTEGVKHLIMTTWPDLVKDYLKNEDFGKYINKCEKSAEKIIPADSVLGKPQRQIANYIVDFTKNIFVWNGVNRQFANKSAAELVKEKSGNSADINLWLTGALRAFGIEAYPVILSTRSHGKIVADYPFSSAFNFVVVCAFIDGKAYWADATDTYCQFGKIPISCINDLGLMVDKDKMKWLSLQYNDISGVNQMFVIDSVGDNQNIQVAVTASDYEAQKYRNLYATNLPKLKSDLDKKLYETIDGSLMMRNATEVAKPFVFSYKMKTRTEKINNKIYISPFIAEVLSKNPFKQNSRTYPIDFIYPVRKTFVSDITIPEGYKVDFLPENITTDDDLFSLDYSVSESDGVVHVWFSYCTKQSVYSSDKYARIKAHFERVVKKGNEKIVFSKI